MASCLPYFFEEINGDAVTVNGNRYRQMIQEYLLPEIEDNKQRNIFFKQDGATAHTARATMEMLKAIFPIRLISRFGDMPWPPRSPDLSAPDFLLWGYSKEKIYIEMPDTLRQ